MENIKYQCRAIKFDKKLKRISFSRTNEFENFDLGQAYDNEAIEFDFHSRYTKEECTDYKIFTSETQLYVVIIMGNIVEFWQVKGIPLTPTNIYLKHLYTKDEWND